MFRASAGLLIAMGILIPVIAVIGFIGTVEESRVLLSIVSGYVYGIALLL